MEVVTVKLEGLAELERNLNRLRDDHAKKVVMKAVRRGAAIFRSKTLANIRSRFKKQTGLLLGGITVFWRIKSLGVKGSIVRMRIGLRKTGKQGDPWYGRLLESGYRHYGRAGRSSSRGQGRPIPPKPFMQPAFESEKGHVLTAIQQEIAQGLNQFTV